MEIGPIAGCLTTNEPMARGLSDPKHLRPFKLFRFLIPRADKQNQTIWSFSFP